VGFFVPVAVVGAYAQGCLTATMSGPPMCDTSLLTAPVRSIQIPRCGTAPSWGAGIAPSYPFSHRSTNRYLRPTHAGFRLETWLGTSSHRRVESLNGEAEVG